MSNPSESLPNPVARASSSRLYASRHELEIAMQAEQSADGVVVCPILMEDILTHNKQETVSHLLLGGRKQIIGLSYYTLAAMQECLRRKPNTDPVTQRPFLSAMPARIKIATEALKYEGHLNPAEIPALFRSWLADPNGFALACPREYALLRRDLHVGDAGILSTWDVHGMDMRDKALNLLKSKPPGSWLIRSSSVESTSVFKVQAISFITSSGQISHTLVAHCYGYGHMLIDADRGDPMPDFTNGVSNNVPMPTMASHCVFGSFLDLLYYNTKTAPLFELNRMVCNE